MTILDLIAYIRATNQHVLIEVEAKSSPMQDFINEYNSKYEPQITAHTYGVVLLQDNADKWGVELRIYFVSIQGMPQDYRAKARRNDTYKNQYSYRINNNDDVNLLFENGFRIGIN